MSRINSIQDLRDSAPQELRGASDERLIIEFSNDIGRDPFEVAEILGENRCR